MRARYERNSEGRMVLRARVYPASEHPIKKQFLSKEVLHIIDRLQSRGFQACVVGGAVRDLLIGRTPKDFDVACSARPEEVRRVFSNSRIIGKRFRLVHIVFPGNHIVEVATFRAIDNSDHQPVYGTIDQDAKRRDFSLNGLYYDPKKEVIIDYVDGMADVRKRVIRPIIPLDQIFIEDPVRILRCLKFSAMFNFRVAAALSRQLKRDLLLLATSSHSRLSEELLKILLSGYSATIFRTLFACEACSVLLPHYPLCPRDRRKNKVVLASLEQLDALRPKTSPPLGIALSYLLAPALQAQHFASVGNDARPLFLYIKELLSPLSFANMEILRCISHLCQQRGIDLSFTKLLTQKWIQRRQGYAARRRRGNAPPIKKGAQGEKNEQDKPKRQTRQPKLPLKGKPMHTPSDATPQKRHRPSRPSGHGKP